MAKQKLLQICICMHSCVSVLVIMGHYIAFGYFPLNVTTEFIREDCYQ